MIILEEIEEQINEEGEEGRGIVLEYISPPAFSPSIQRHLYVNTHTHSIHTCARTRMHIHTDTIPW